MSWAFYLQTFAPVGFGLVFMWSGLLAAEPKWLGRLAFLLAQLLQIYAFGFGSIVGLGLVVSVLCGFAAFAAAPATSARGRAIGSAAFFAIYVLYWAFQKYFVPLVILPQAAHGTFGPLQDVAPLIGVIGTSYIGFKFLHFFIDFRAGEIARVEPLGFLSWLLFFPSIVAGPMQRFEDWQQQFEMSALTFDQAIWGLRRILLGLLMKIAFADNMYNFTLPHMTTGALSTAPWSVMIFGALVYFLYLYLDFAGYCHIAIGTGVFWGIRLPENFNNPFLSRNLAEFWNRWHITLSQILRDYLFYPVSLKVKRTRSLRRHPIIATAIPPIVTFLLAGLWHGAVPGFIILGLMHGVGLAYLAVRRGRNPRGARAIWWYNSRARYLCAAGFNYCYVSTSLIFFSLPPEKLGIVMGRLLGHS